MCAARKHTVVKLELVYADLSPASTGTERLVKSTETFRMSTDFGLNLLYRDLLSTPTDGERLLESVASLGPLFLPDRFGRWEPVRTAYSQQAALEVWNWLMLFRKLKPSLWMQTSGLLGPRPSLSSFSIRGASPRLIEFLLPGALDTLARPFDCQLGLLHILTPGDVLRGLKSRTVNFFTGKLSLKVATQHLVVSLPDVYWGTLFGSAYIELFGRDRLLSAPCFKAEEISADRIYLQMTERLSDCLKKPAEVDAVRERVRAHLGCNAIFDPALPADHEYAVPDFRMQAGL